MDAVELLRYAGAPTWRIILLRFFDLCILAGNSPTIERTVTDDTLPGGPRERTIVYEAPFDQCDREEDYRTAWTEFARRQA